MTIQLHRPILTVFLCSVFLGAVACDEIGEQLDSVLLPSCDNQRETAGWKVISGLAKDSSGELVVSKWEAAKNFGSFFGIRITFDTSQGQSPFLKIWHDYKSGDFTMVFPDGSRLSTRLDANYAVSTTPLPSNYADTLARTPVRIEHTSHDRKWKVYQTNGLPEAIAAGKTDLEHAKKKLNDKECAL